MRLIPGFTMERNISEVWFQHLIFTYDHSYHWNNITVSHGHPTIRSWLHINYTKRGGLPKSREIYDNIIKNK